jgi:hypothetical protein
MRFFAIALSIAAFSTLARPSQAASINCLLRSQHPVCVAVFAAYPPGGQTPNNVMSGNAQVSAKTVHWTCRGAKSPTDPLGRPCHY